MIHFQHFFISENINTQFQNIYKTRRLLRTKPDINYEYKKSYLFYHGTFPNVAGHFNEPFP